MIIKQTNAPALIKSPNHLYFSKLKKLNEKLRSALRQRANSKILKNFTAELKEVFVIVKKVREEKAKPKQPELPFTSTHSAPSNSGHVDETTVSSSFEFSIKNKVQLC